MQQHPAVGTFYVSVKLELHNVIRMQSNAGISDLLVCVIYCYVSFIRIQSLNSIQYVLLKVPDLSTTY